MDLAKVVSSKAANECTETGWKLGEGDGKVENARFHIARFRLGAAPISSHMA